MLPALVLTRRLTRSDRRGWLSQSVSVLLPSFMLSWLPVASAADPSVISKVFFAEVEGDDAYVQIGDRSQPVSAKETYRADGLGIDTGAGSAVTMVFSNGLAVQLQADTRIAVKRFDQEPFRPNRTDVAVEPSISDVQLEMLHGTAVISTSGLAPGSRFEVLTQRASVNIQGGTMVVTSTPTETRVSVVTGTCTIYGRNDGTVFRAVKEGESAIVRLASPNQLTSSLIITVTRLPTAQVAALTAEVSDASLAKRTVYFEQRNVSNTFASTMTIGSPGPGARPGSSSGTVDLNAIPLVPSQLPVQFTISPASIISSSGH